MELPTPPIPQPMPLAWCLERAARANPDLSRRAADADASFERINPAGALDDPRFSYEASNLPVGDLGFDATPLSGNQLGLRQKLPFPGLLGSRRRAARAAAEAASHGVEDERRRVASRVESAWAELAFAQRALEITDRNIELVRQLTRIAEARYGVGAGLQQDVLLAQVQLTTLLGERLRRTAGVATSTARLAGLLDLPHPTAFPRTDALADSAEVPALEPLLERLERTSPALKVAASRIEAARERQRAARLEGYPEVDLGFGYRIRKRVAGDPVEGDDFLSAGLTIRLPIDRSRWRARVAEQAALVRREEAAYRGERARLASELSGAFAALVSADAQALLLETGLVPQARQSLDSSRSGYEVGRIDFESLLDSQVRLLAAELERVRALADRRVAFSALEAALGEAIR